MQGRQFIRISAGGAAWRIELITPRIIMESMNLLRVGPSEIAQYRDSISLNAPMVRALAAVGLFDSRKAWAR